MTATPERRVESERSIATQEELSEFIGEGEGEGSESLVQEELSEFVGEGKREGSESLVIEGNGGLPGFGEFVYVEELPQAIIKVQPVYPDHARQSGIEGVVHVQALIGKDGKVKDIKVVQGIPALDAAAIAAVEKWVFKPALTNDKPVAVWVAIPVRFALR